MSFTVTDDAIADVTGTSHFYDTRPGQYGAVFEDETETAFRKIAAAPRMY